VYDGVVGPWFIGEFTRACRAARVELDYVLLIPSVEECLHRVAHRADHPFGDPDATTRMHEHFDGAEIDPRHLLRPPPVSIDDTVAAVEAARQAGALRIGKPVATQTPTQGHQTRATRSEGCNGR